MGVLRVAALVLLTPSARVTRSPDVLSYIEARALYAKADRLSMVSVIYVRRTRPAYGVIKSRSDPTYRVITKMRIPLTRTRAQYRVSLNSGELTT